MTGGTAVPIVARDPAMREVLQILEKVRHQDSPVLLAGESGTGKSLLARTLHFTGARAGGPWIEVACANLSPELMESELFGHEKGAFSGATDRRLGKFELADGGTLFLDQVSELPTPSQAKLLRVLEQGTFERLGGGRTLTTDVRIVASTSQLVREMVAQKVFRKDLFFRLAVFFIEVPPLRERPADIVPLAEAFLEKYARLYGRAARKLAPDAKDLLRGYGWPGNVRELENVLERAVVLCDGPELAASHLPAQQLVRESDLLAEAERDRWSLEELEANYIRRVLRLTEGNKSAAARILGIHRKTLLEKRKKYGIP